MDINAFAKFRIVFDNTCTGYVIYNFTNLTPFATRTCLKCLIISILPNTPVGEINILEWD